MTRFFTIGYGGRTWEDFSERLLSRKVRTLVDIRLRPDKASMGIWVQAKKPDKGIASRLAGIGINYLWIVELGNVFLGERDWMPLYTRLLDESGELLTRRIQLAEAPFCLMCAEKRASECHRTQVADFLVRTRGDEVEHLE